MKKLFAILALCLCALGCTPAASPSSGPSQAQLDAQAAVKVLNDAWQASADACMAAEDSGLLKGTPCSQVFVPIYDSIVLASNMVDTWDASSQEQLPCLMKQIMADLIAGEKVLTDAKLSIPPAVLTAQTAIETFVGALCPADAGAE